MRILWITHDVFEPFFPFAKGKPSSSASWTTPLFFSLQTEMNVKLGSIVPIIDGEQQKMEIENIIYYSVPVGSKSNIRTMNNKLVENYLWAIHDFNPDIIHIHGIEKNFGLIRNFVDPRIPIVCSIQGVVQPCLNFLKYSVANLNINQYKSVKNRLGRGGVRTAVSIWKNYCSIEKEIFEINQYFIGRTSWDKAQLYAFNPDAHYYHGEELLRLPFYSQSWNISTCKRHRVFISSAANPIKGFHVLLQAISILKHKYADIQAVVPMSSLNMKFSNLRDFLFSEDYANYLKKEIRRLGLENNILFLNKLSATEMAEEYRNAHVFTLTSYIENSPNSLGEAMLIGTPTVVSPVGGVMSLVKNEASSLYFPSGDAEMLAFQIDRLFSNDELAEKLSQNAKKIAMKRHDIVETTNQYMKIYAEVIQKHHERT